MIPALVVFLVSGGRPLHRHLRVPHVNGRATPRITSSPAARSDPTVFLLSLFGTNMTAFSILGASGHAFANGIVTFGLMASSSALVIPVCLFAIGTRLVGARQAPSLHDAGADVPRSVGMPPHRHGHLRRAGRAARALHHHRGHGRRDGPSRDHQWLHSLLARRRHRLVGRHGVRVSRRHARNGLGQRAADDAVSAVRDDRGCSSSAPAWADSARRWRRCSHRRRHRRC